MNLTWLEGIGTRENTGPRIQASEGTTNTYVGLIEPFGGNLEDTEIALFFRELLETNYPRLPA